MSLSVNPVNYTNQISNVRNSNQISKVDFKANLEEKADSVEISTKKELTVEDKQKMLKKACAKAAGWSIFGGLFSTAYYAFRSDEKVARKFGLDVEKDKRFISQIKHEQTFYSLIGLLPLIGGVIGYAIAENRNVDNIVTA